MRLKKIALTLSLILTITTIPISSDKAYGQNLAIPDIGTAGVMGLSIQKEQQIGDFFMRTARAYMPIIDDPVLTEYVQSLGNKLLINANHVNFPFEFFIVNDQSLNASAFLGGKLKINSGLLFYCETEDEFASVLSHEISHVTQRHIARFIESQSQNNNLTIGALIGAIAMSIINPAVGMAALSTTMGASVQSSINFTRDNEYEADRLGIDLLYKSGFNPQGMTDMFKKLLSNQGNINPAFTLLIDHPLTEIRVSEARSRVYQLPKRENSKNVDFYFAKARSDVRYMNTSPQSIINSIELKGLNDSYDNYALSLAYYELKDYTKASLYLDKLEKYKDNLFIIDLKTDILIAQNKFDSAINMLLNAKKRSPKNKTISVNLANAYMEQGLNDKAINTLLKFLNYQNDDITALSMLSDLYFKVNKRCEGLQARGKVLALSANYNHAIGQFNEALTICSDFYVKEKIKAQVSQIANQRAFDEVLNNSL